MSTIVEEPELLLDTKSPLGEGPMMGSWIYGGIAMMVLIYIGQRGD